MSNRFIWTIDRTLSGATTQGQSGPGGDSNEGLVGWFVSQSINTFQVISRQIKFQTIQFSIIIDLVYKQLNVKTVLFQTIQYSIGTQFSSIRPIDETLSGATTQRVPVSDGNEMVLCIPQSYSITGISP